MIAETTVIARFCFFELFEIGFQLFLRSPRCAVDTLKLRVLCVAPPIGAGDLHQLERVAYLTRAGQVRAATKIKPVSLSIDSNDLILGKVLDQLRFEILAHVAKFGDGFIAVPDFAHEIIVATNDLAHLLLDGFEIVLGKRLIAMKIVVESVLDNGADRDLGPREKLLHGLSEHMGSVVSDQFDPFRVLISDQLNLCITLDRAGCIAQLPIQLCGQNFLRQRFGDGGRDLHWGHIVLIFAGCAVRESQGQHGITVWSIQNLGNGKDSGKEQAVTGRTSQDDPRLRELMTARPCAPNEAEAGRIMPKNRLLPAALAGLSALFAIALPAWADNVTSAQLIEAGAVIDVEHGRTLSDQDILVEDGMITAMGARGSVTRPEGVKVIDLRDMTVLPGLMDSHVHLTGDASVHGLRGLTRSVPRAAITGVRNAKRTLEAGFTTVRNLGAPGFADVALMEAIADGDVPGPRIIPAGRSIGITGGHCDSNLLPFEKRDVAGGVADGPWAVRAKVRENKKYGAQVIKFCGTGGVLSKGTSIGAQQFSFEEMKAIVDEANLLGLKVAVHAHGTVGIKTAIEAGVHSVEHASMISDRSIQAAIDAGTILSMDIYVSDYILSEGEDAGISEESLAKERQVGRVQRERFKAAVDAGATMGFGTDAGVYPHGQNGRQFKYAVQWGQTPMQAIQSATIINARLFGIEAGTGSITVGKQADLIAVDGDPLSDISELEDVDFVMRGGSVYKSHILNP